jgi:hypothetical protein
VKYDRIEMMRQDYPVTLLCRVFEIGASGYYVGPAKFSLLDARRPMGHFVGAGRLSGRKRPVRKQRMRRGSVRKGVLPSGRELSRSADMINHKTTGSCHTKRA